MSSKHVRIAIDTSPAIGSAFTMHLILCHLADSDGLVSGHSLKDLARASRLKQRAAQYALSSLCDDGHIERIDRPGRASDYVVSMADEMALTHAPRCTPARSCTPAPRCTPTPAPRCMGQGVDSTGSNSMGDNGVTEVLGGSKNGEKFISTVYTLKRDNKKEEKKERKNTRLKFDFSTWQMKFAAAFWQRFLDVDLLAKSQASLPESKREKELQKWAAEIDKLHRLDGHSQEDIAAVAKWLFSPGNWWTEKGNIRTVMKFRRTTDSEEKYFDILLRQMEGSKPSDPLDPDAYLTETQMKAACKAHGLTPDDFNPRGKDRNGERLFTLKQEVAHA